MSINKINEASLMALGMSRTDIAALRFSLAQAQTVYDASPLNTPNAVVQRDASGNFAAGTITAALTGTASNAAALGGVAAASYATISYASTTYAPLTGAGASGTWGISITGNAATATNATQLGGVAAASYATTSYVSTTYAPLTGAGTSGTWGISISGNAATATNSLSLGGVLAASYLQSSAIGVTVQAYDADLTAFAAKTAPSGAVVGTSDTQTLTAKTLTSPTITTPTITGTESHGGGVTEYFSKTQNVSGNAIKVNITFTSQNAAQVGHFLEINLAAANGGSATRYAATVRYALNTLTNVASTLMATDLTGCTESNGAAGMVFTSTITLAGAVVPDYVMVSARVLTSQSVAIPTGMTVT